MWSQPTAMCYGQAAKSSGNQGSGAELWLSVLLAPDLADFIFSSFL